MQTMLAASRGRLARLLGAGRHNLCLCPRLTDSLNRNPVFLMDEKQQQMMREKYADMYLTMISLLPEEELSAKSTPVPQKPVAEAESEYSI